MVTPPQFPVSFGPWTDRINFSFSLDDLDISHNSLVTVTQHVFTSSNNGMQVPPFYRNSEEVPYYFKMSSNSCNFTGIKNQSLIPGSPLQSYSG